MGKLDWYWHRLRAMERGEVAAHVRKKLYQFQDARRLPDWSDVSLESAGAFPKLPSPDSAPVVLREALKRDASDILAGRWTAFGHLEIHVDDPPRWHKDYLAGKDLETSESAFKLNHRELPGGADIKLIWELSRWYQIVHLAMAAYVLDHERAAGKCVEWLEDWVEHNPSYRGWNWTSALEAGMRLVQFTWIDALLSTRSGGEKSAANKNSAALSRDAATLERLRREILPAHVWYAWRYRSFGSSANNHLLGELTGLILAIARWAELAGLAAPLEELQGMWENEVLAQFAEDGGNREQALNYHLFSWEFCWQARMALVAAGRSVSTKVDGRLRRALEFFLAVQVDTDPWDYGDSDNAFVTPLFVDWNRALVEWRNWLRYPESSPALRFWLGTELPAKGSDATNPSGGWQIFPESGIAVHHSENWMARWDVSALGYLATAAHGHLDALHLSLWRRGVAIVIDPGTGAYYADKALRTHLASWEAHNGPHAVGKDFPKRLGPFLWSKHHADPNLKPGSDSGLLGELKLPSGIASRKVTMLPREEGWRVEDRFQPDGRADYEFAVHWQFAPQSQLEQIGGRKLRVTRHGQTVEVEVDANWSRVEPVFDRRDGSFDGICSPVFRETCFAPCLKLTARGHNPCVFTTTFLASHSS